MKCIREEVCNIEIPVEMKNKMSLQTAQFRQYDQLKVRSAETLFQ